MFNDISFDYYFSSRISNNLSGKYSFSLKSSNSIFSCTSLFKRFYFLICAEAINSFSLLSSRAFSCYVFDLTVYSINWQSVSAYYINVFILLIYKSVLPLPSLILSIRARYPFITSSEASLYIM